MQIEGALLIYNYTRCTNFKHAELKTAEVYKDNLDKDTVELMALLKQSKLEL